MTDLIALAKQAGFDTSKGHPIVRHSNGAWVGISEQLQAFADLIRKDERERLAFEEYIRLSQSINDKLEDYQSDQTHAPELVALADQAIRARTTT